MKGLSQLLRKPGKSDCPSACCRYQFGPLEAAYATGNADDLFLLSNYALDRTPNSEEALTWKGWAFMLNKQDASARSSFQRALEVHPNDAAAMKGLRSPPGSSISRFNFQVNAR